MTTGPIPSISPQLYACFGLSPRREWSSAADHAPVLCLGGGQGSASQGTSAIREKLLLQNRPGTETILYVEDEPPLREVIAGLLRELGYRILEAGDAREAIAVSSSHADEIHLLLTDVIMPDMDGPQLSVQLQASRPRMKVLYVSGYSESVLEAHGLPQHAKFLLQKPFTIKVLSAKIREVLDSPPGQPHGDD